MASIFCICMTVALAAKQLPVPYSSIPTADVSIMITIHQATYGCHFQLSTLSPLSRADAPYLPLQASQIGLCTA